MGAAPDRREIDWVCRCGVAGAEGDSASFSGGDGDSEGKAGALELIP